MNIYINKRTNYNFLPLYHHHSIDHRIEYPHPILNFYPQHSFFMAYEIQSRPDKYFQKPDKFRPLL